MILKCSEINPSVIEQNKGRSKDTKFLLNINDIVICEIAEHFLKYSLLLK